MAFSETTLLQIVSYQVDYVSGKGNVQFLIKFKLKSLKINYVIDFEINNIVQVLNKLKKKYTIPFKHA